MPIVSDVFSYTGGTSPGPAGTAVSSTKTGTRDDDVLNALNTTQSIARGGTGSVSAVGAADNLSTTSSSISSATTTDLSAATGIHVTITGTTNITGFGTEQAGAERKLTFGGALTITHNATSMILGFDITTVAGDTATFVSEGSGNWRLISYKTIDERSLRAPFIDTVAPMVTDDASDGYLVGDKWYILSTLKVYELIDSTNGAAVWVDVSASGDQWESKPIGEPFPLWDHITGVDQPPTDQTYRFVLLSYGHDGGGEYNLGITTNESTSGSSPDIVATFDIDLAASPLDGETIRCINDEGRFLRPGTTSGVTQDSQNEAHTHTTKNFANFNGVTGANSGFQQEVAGTSTGSSGGTEARPRNISARYYMRIL